MNITKTKATKAATTVLAEHHAAIATINAKAMSLRHRVAGFADAENAEQPTQQEVSVLEAQRVEMLGAVALQERPHSELDVLDRRLAEARQRAQAAARQHEIAAAGRMRLQRDLDSLNAEIAPLAASLPALQYAAGVELAQAKIEAYRTALVQLGEAHAALAGALQAADEFSNFTCDPRRLPVLGELFRFEFSAPLPNLPGIKPEDWKFNVTDQAAAAKSAALAVLRDA